MQNNKELITEFRSRILHIDQNLGQNYLLNLSILERIVDAIDLSNKNIVEIGSGIGNLTHFILKKQPKKLECIELDTKYATQLQTLYSNIIIKNTCCLKAQIDTDIIIGNLPYNISVEFIINCILNNRYNRMLFMVQREVAERIIAKPSKKYGVFSVLCQAINNCKILFNVSNNNFYPKPKVESSIILLDKQNDLPDIYKFFFMLKKIFQHRRKKSHLKGLYDLRPDQITVQQYIEYYSS